uniref:SANT domain-containing protein n=1 Tax=Anopheles dirus TaxID=7168 RepID=A0A182NN99_9DIPT
MGPHLLGSSSLTDDEVGRLKKLLQEHGPKWNQFAESLSKPALALKSCYFHYQKKYGLDVALNEYYKLHPSEDRRSAMTDGDESDLSAGCSSSDERDGSSDTTASAESPTSGNAGGNSVGIGNVPAVVKNTGSSVKDGAAVSEDVSLSKLEESGRIMLGGSLALSTVGNSANTSISGSETAISLAPPPKAITTITGSSSSTSSGSSGVAYEDDRLLPPGQPQPRKPLRHTEEYDSSATETADEENESSPANRQSPKVSMHHPPVPHAHYPPPLHHGAGLSMMHNAIPGNQQQSNGSRSNAIGGGSGGELSSPQNVRDVMLNVIERSLKSNSLVTASKPPPPGLRDLQFGPNVNAPVSSGQQIQPALGSVPAISTTGANASSSSTSTMVRDYRDGTKVVLNPAGGISQVIGPGVGPVVSSSSPAQQPGQHSMPTSATLGMTMVNSHGQIMTSSGQTSHSAIPPPLVGSHMHNHPLVGQIPATITPITHSIHLGSSSGMNSSIGRAANDEPQTLDLSIKKPPRADTITSVSATTTKLIEISNNTSSDGGGNFPPPPAHSHSNSNHLGAAPAGSNGSGGGSANNSVNKFHLGHPGPPNSLGASVTVYRTDGSFSGPNIPPSSVGAGGATYVSYHPSVAPDAMGRPLTKSPSGVGTTTYLTLPLGTGSVQGGLSMQVPPGSGRQSALSSLTPPPPLSGSGGPKGKLTPKLSPKMTSGSSSSGGPKGGSITHGTPVNVNQQQQQQSQTQLIIQGQPPSGATLSPRQGVIQRHNTSVNNNNSSGAGNVGGNSGNTGSGTGGMVAGGGGASSKPPSPAPTRYQLQPPPHPHHYLQDAFTSFVDLAVQQPPMTVPHKDDPKRAIIDQQHHPPPTASSGLSIVGSSSSVHHHDMRYQHPGMIPFHHQHPQHQQIKSHSQSQQQPLPLTQTSSQQQQQHAQQLSQEQSNHWALLQCINEMCTRIIIGIGIGGMNRISANVRSLSVVLWLNVRNVKEIVSVNAIIVNANGNANVIVNANEIANGTATENVNVNENVNGIIVSVVRWSVSSSNASICIVTVSENGLIVIRSLKNGVGSSTMMASCQIDEIDTVHPLHNRRDGGGISGNSQSGVKNITLGELTESIIAKDYSPNPNPFLQLRPPMIPYGAAAAGTAGAEAILAADQWKHRRPTTVTTPGKEDQRSHDAQKGPGRLTPEDRHIIRLAQSPGPRIGGSGGAGAGGQGAPHAGGGGRDNFVIDFYVKNRIVEAMRTEDEKRASDASMVVVVDGGVPGGNRNTERQQQSSPRSFQNISPHHTQTSMSHHHAKEVALLDRSGTPASGASEGPHQSHHATVDEQKQQHQQHSTASALLTTSSPTVVHSTYHQQPITTFNTPPTYAYPFSALTVASGAPPTSSSSGHPPSSTSSSTTAITASMVTGGSSSGSGIKSIGTGMILAGTGPTVAGGLGGNSSIGVSSAGGGNGPALTDDRHIAPALEPKPLLSAQYEALSDED